MLETIEAIYENGIFKPLHPVDLPEGTRVTIATGSTAQTDIEVTQPLETPVAPGIVRRPDRGFCVAGTKISLFAIMDYVNAGAQQDLLTYGQLSAGQLQQALNYIAANRPEFDLAYAEYVRKATELEHYYRNRERQHRAELAAQGLWPPRNHTPAQAAIWERLQTRQPKDESQ